MSVPKSGGVRPTTGRARQAVFSALGAVVEDSTALDLFAGTGAYGVEALSRGAACVEFVDHDRAAADTLTAMIKKLGVERRARVTRCDAMRALRVFGELHVRFDLVFLDPPYGSADLARVWAAPLFSASLRPGGLVVVETRARTVSLPEIPGFVPYFSRRYGETMIEMFAWEEVLKR